jgi:hypothetical protein
MKTSKFLAVLFIVCSAYSVNNTSAQWINVSAGMGNYQVYSLFADGNNLFAGTFNHGLFISTNNGTNWNLAGTSLYSRIVFSLTKFGGYLYAGTDLGVWRTSNNGAYWSVTSINNNSTYSLASNQTRVFAGLHNSGLFYSSGGTGWFISSLNATNIKAINVNGNFIIAGAGNNSGVFVSANNGANWVSSSLNNKSVYSLALNGNYAFAGTGSGVYVSADSGYTWTQTSLNNELVLSLVTNGNYVFAGTELNGVYVSSNNGNSWIQNNDGMGNITVYSLCITNNYIFAGVSANSVYRRLLGELVPIEISSSQIPMEFSLEQNYPNPFNPHTTINYSIPVNGEAELTISDITGKVVEVLVKKYQYKGMYSVKFDGSYLSTGIYFYRLKAQGFTSTKKMIIVK